MNRLITPLRGLMAVLSLMTAVSGSAQLSGSGYYRLLNTETGRYLTITNDNVGTSMNSAFSALVTVKGFENVESNPASILYLRNVSGTLYDVVCQGADSYVLVEDHFNITGTGNVYQAWVRYLVTTYYLGDNVSDNTRSQADINGTARNWYILPVNLSTNQYFGFTAEVQDRTDKRYTTCIASFPMEIYDSGVQAYYVSHVVGKYAVMQELNGVIPPATPVIIKCNGREAKTNRVTIPAKSPAALTGNLLKGVYFDKTNGLNPEWTPYDANTMRLIGLTSEGKLGMVKSTRYRLPANKAYLPVEAGSPDELTLITYEDYVRQFGPLTTKGDVNGDGKVDVGDIMAIINAMTTAVPGASASGRAVDVNGDGKVDVGDIMAVINLMAK